MEKYTKRSKKVEEKIKEDNKPLFENEYLKVLDVEGWTIVDEKDMVVTIPYLVEYNQIVLRLEDVPTFKFKFPEMSHFVTCVSGTIEKGESPKETLFRELKEETGIVVNDDYEVDFSMPLFSSKGNTAQYNICILPLYEKDYYEVIPEGDGSDSEKKSKNVKLDIKFINNVTTNDLITTHLLTLIKKYANIK